MAGRRRRGEIAPHASFTVDHGEGRSADQVLTYAEPRVLRYSWDSPTSHLLRSNSNLSPLALARHSPCRIRCRPTWSILTRTVGQCISRFSRPRPLASRCRRACSGNCMRQCRDSPALAIASLLTAAEPSPRLVPAAGIRPALQRNGATPRGSAAPRITLRRATPACSRRGNR